MKRTEKDRKRSKLLEYLTNPENEDWRRTYIATEVLGYKQPETIYNIFTPQELDEVFAEALDLRRQRYASQLAAIDSALFKRAASGDPQAAKLIYQRFEGWAEKREQKNTGSLTVIVDGATIHEEGV